MIAWLVRGLLVACVAASVGTGWNEGASVASDVVDDALAAPSTAAPYRLTLSGASLLERVRAEIAVANAAREARLHADRARMAVLERVDFERSAGGVVARGSMTDLGGPRRLYVVIDAFDADRTYVASGTSSVDTLASSSPFSVSMTDDDRFSSFAVRFLDDGMSEIETRTPDAPRLTLPPLLADDMLHSGDMPEVVSRLAALGYAPSIQKVVGDAATFALVRRFRADHALDGPGVVTVGDLAALRLVSPSAPRSADLSLY